MFFNQREKNNKQHTQRKLVEEGALTVIRTKSMYLSA